MLLKGNNRGGDRKHAANNNNTDKYYSKIYSRSVRKQNCDICNRYNIVASYNSPISVILK
jgi:hypothetical protein